MSVHLLRKVRLTRVRRPLYHSLRYFASPSPQLSHPTESHAGPSQEPWQLDIEEVNVDSAQDADQFSAQENEQLSDFSRTLQPTSRQYLLALEASDRLPTIQELERYRPGRHPPPTSPKYPTEYNEIINSLCRTFSKAQLLHFLEQSPSIAGRWRRSSTKIVFAEYIVEKLWGWPSLREVERAKRDRTEVVRQSFHVSPSQLFLLLGKDGSDLLQLTKTYNVHISFTRSPLALQVEGLRGDMKKLSEHFSNFRKGITEETFQLPTKTPIQKDMVQRISRLAGAYLENIGSEGKVRVCAKSSKSLTAAKRLIIRATIEFADNLKASVVAAEPLDEFLMPSEHYTLFPFVSSRSWPWFMGTGGAFRFRRIGNPVFSSLDRQDTGGINGARILSPQLEPVDIRKILYDALPVASDTGRKRTLKVSTGHILINTALQAQRTSILSPPLQGSLTFQAMLEWVTNWPAKTTFVPSFPPPFINLPPTTKKILHRLTYHAFDPQQVTPPSTSYSNPISTDSLVHHAKVLSFEVLVSDHNRTQSENPQPEEPPVSDFDKTWQDAIAREVPLLDPSSTPVSCWSGHEVEVSLMLPDRPMDAKMTMVDYHDVPVDQLPPELKTYLNALRSYLAGIDTNAERPDAPLYITVGGETYTLRLSSSVQQSLEDVDSLSESAVEEPTAGHGSSMKVVNETIVDLESDQKITRSELTCEDHDSDESWKQFLAECDKLTAASYSSKAMESILENNDNVQL